MYLNQFLIKYFSKYFLILLYMNISDSVTNTDFVTTTHTNYLIFKQFEEVQIESRKIEILQNYRNIKDIFVKCNIMLLCATCVRRFYV